MRVLGIDTGTQHLGWAVLRWDLSTARTLLTHYGTLKPQPRSEAREALDELYLGARSLLSRYAPDVMVLESYQWMGQQRRATNRDAMLQLQGMLLTLRWCDPYPDVHLLPPSVWMPQLAGPGRTPKDHLAWIIEQRLGCTIDEKRGAHYGNHATDAAGAALAWLDQQAVAGETPRTHATL